MVKVREPRLTAALCGLLFLAGWTGSHCEDDINECLPQPCNQGICIQNDPGYGYTCFCRPGFVVRVPTLLLFFFPLYHCPSAPPVLFFSTYLCKFPWFLSHYRSVLYFLEMKAWICSKNNISIFWKLGKHKCLLNGCFLYWKLISAFVYKMTAFFVLGVGGFTIWSGSLEAVFGTLELWYVCRYFN